VSICSFCLRHSLDGEVVSAAIVARLVRTHIKEVAMGGDGDHGHRHHSHTDFGAFGKRLVVSPYQPTYSPKAPRRCQHTQLNRRKSLCGNTLSEDAKSPCVFGAFVRLAPSKAPTWHLRWRLRRVYCGAMTYDDIWYYLAPSLASSECVLSAKDLRRRLCRRRQIYARMGELASSVAAVVRGRRARRALRSSFRATYSTRRASQRSMKP
jgi:hypothetical protein